MIAKAQGELSLCTVSFGGEALLFVPEIEGETLADFFACQIRCLSFKIHGLSSGSVQNDTLLGRFWDPLGTLWGSFGTLWDPF